MTKHAKVSVTWSPDLGSSLVKDAHSLILYSIFSEQRFYLRSFFSPHAETVVRPLITVLVLGSTEVLLGLNPNLRFTSCSGNASLFSIHPG